MEGTPLFILPKPLHAVSAYNILARAGAQAGNRGALARAGGGVLWPCRHIRMPDSLYIGRLEAVDVAFAYAITTDTVNEAVCRHDCDPAAAHVLGRAITGGMLAAAGLGEGQRLNLRWAYEGILRTVVVDAGPDGATRAFVQPASLAQCEDGASLYGDRGTLQVVRTRKGAVVASGHVDVRLQDVVEDLAFFLCTSDQVESGAVSMIGFAAQPERPVSICRGLLIQALPGCDLERFSRIRARLDDDHLRGLMARTEESDSLFENVLNLLTRGMTENPRLKFAAGPSPVFRCACSREKMGAVLRALPYQERMDIVQRKEDVVVACRFCNERYQLSIDDCIRAWNEKPAPPA